MRNLADTSRCMQFIVLTALVLIGATAMGTASNVINDSGYADAIDASTDSIAQEVRFAVELSEPGTAEVSVDTAALPEGITVESASVRSAWDARIVDQGPDQTVVTLDSGDSAGDAGVELVFDLDISAFDGDEQDITYTVTVDGGNSVSVPVAIQTGVEDEPDEREAEPSADETQESTGPQTVTYVTVLDPDGNPLPADTIDAWAQRGLSTSHGTVQDDGTVQLSPEPGTWTLRADADGYAPGVMENVDLSEGEREEPYEIRVQDGGKLQGAVTDTDGNPVEDVTVEIEDSDGVRTLAHTDTDGTYDITLAPGSYSVRAFDDTRVSEDYDVVSLSAPDETATADFTLQSPSIVSASVEHVDGTAPDMDAFDIQTATQGGMVFIELGPDAVGSTMEDAFTPQDLSAYGVDDTTVFEISLTVETFDPDSLIWAARDVDWETSAAGDTVDVTVQVTPTHMETIDAVHTGPTTDGDDITWPSGTNDAADNSYEQAVQFALIETPGLNPAERQALRGMSATTNAQAFGFPRVEDGELSVYLGAPGEQVDGEQHTGFYSVFLPDTLLADWDVSEPEEELEAMWNGEPESFEVEELDDGAHIEIDPITYSDGTFTLRSTVYEETLLDRIPSIREISHLTGQILQETRIWLALRLP